MGNVISSYMPLVIHLLFIFLAWRFGDWKNWRKYYPTIIFFITVDFFSSILTYNHSLWYLEPAVFLRNHTLRDFFMVIIGFPPLILLYLSRYPYQSPFFNQLFYIMVWIGIGASLEGIILLTKKITYYNGWNYGWSLVLWCVMYPVLRIHHTRPILAWLVCVGYTLFVVSYFHIPIMKMK